MYIPIQIENRQLTNSSGFWISSISLDFQTYIIFVIQLSLQVETVYKEEYIFMCIPRTEIYFFKRYKYHVYIIIL